MAAGLRLVWLFFGDGYVFVDADVDVIFLLLDFIVLLWWSRFRELAEEAGAVGCR